MKFCLRGGMYNFKKMVEGRSVWVAGCGPTLGDHDLRAMKHDVVLCLNAAITLFTKNKNSWWVFRDLRAFYECTSTLEKSWRRWRVITESKAAARVTLRGRKAPGSALTVYDYDSSLVEHRRTVLEDALQLLDMAGAAEAYLVGVDHAVRDFKPYAESLLWKTCHFYRLDLGKEMKPVSRPLTNMAKVMAELVPKLKMRVYNTSTIYPIDGVFEKVTYEEAVKRLERIRN